MKKPYWKIITVGMAMIGTMSCQPDKPIEI